MKRTTRWLARFLALGMAWVAASLGAGGAGVEASREVGPATIGLTQNYRLTSQHVDQVFSIDVYASPGAKGALPVVYVLDGNGFFGLAAQTVGPMIYGGELPPMIIVGVGYEVTSPFDVVTLRVRDLTPSHVAGVAERMAASGMPLPAGVRPGGADAFLKFIETELKPFIAAHYEVNPEDETLVGDSYGGLFALHVAFNATRSFDRYVAGSPALGWDEDKLFRDEEAIASGVKDLPIKLFLSVGALEEEHAMRSNVERMNAILRKRNYPGLELTTHIFPDETHHSVIGATLSRGLRAVFGALPK